MAVECFDPADVLELLDQDTGRDVAADLLDRPDWMRDALCAEPAYADLPWVPPSPEQAGVDPECAAVCRRCLVQRECLAYALADPSLVGTWAGTSARDRRRLRAALRAA